MARAIKKYPALSGLVLLLAFTGCTEKIGDYINENRQASVFPDYTGIVIPPNIAPLNFFIREEGTRYHVEIAAEEENKIIINQTSPAIRIPIKKWHELLNTNKGKELKLDIFVKNEGWKKYTSIVDTIAEEEIESHLVYRIINTQYMYSRKMELCQRSLENFDESLIYENASTKYGCFNCHTFPQNDPQKMSLHLRQVNPGTLILNGDKLVKLKTNTPFTMSAFGYPSWNPNGELIAYSVNIFNEYFLNDRNNYHEVTDQASDLVIYNVKTNTVTTSPKVSTRSRENFPTWSPDGEWLYFISAPETQGDFQSRFYAKYSLLKVLYDAVSNTWSDVDTVLSAYHTGKSITFPRISPDGRYMLFCMIDHGYFSINHAGSDLYLMDFATGEYRKLDINSPANDSYHGWSMNGRWFVFSSKRLNNLFSQPYFSYFDKDGRAHKPFILPQKDPLFYTSYLYNFNIPELVNGKVDLDPGTIRKLFAKAPVQVQFDPDVDVDALSGATWTERQP
ncbi:MAG: PD40 domain-containing protein [Bacteroidales bacterium]|nr:PD40 domain-containing protein [Bacteroidales bacterium]MBN2763392.1 PD40 domain-containing protein [Bacteroidales bacterium]